MTFLSPLIKNFPQWASMPNRLEKSRLFYNKKEYRYFESLDKVEPELKIKVGV